MLEDGDSCDEGFSFELFLIHKPEPNSLCASAFDIKYNAAFGVFEWRIATALCKKIPVLNH